MKLSDFAVIAEILSAAAVVVTLVILIFELQENTRAMQASTMHNISNSAAQAYVEIGLDDDGVVCILFITDGVAAMTAVEAGTATEVQHRQARTLTLGYWMFSQNQYFQYKYETLGEDVWEGYRNAMCRAKNRDSGMLSKLWPTAKLSLNREFIAFIERCST